MYMHMHMYMHMYMCSIPPLGCHRRPACIVIAHIAHAFSPISKKVHVEK